MHKPLKIIQIIDSLAVGGAEMMAVNIANGLSTLGVESYICSTRSEGLLKEKIAKEVNYIFLNKKGIVDVKAIIKLKQYIKQHNIGIIHAHSSSFFIAVMVKLILPSVKIVWHDHYGKSENIDRRKSVALKLSSLFFNQVISVNQILLQWSKSTLLCKKVMFLANFASLLKTSQKTHLKGEEGKRIVCVAAFRPQKDHFNLLQAFEIIINKYPDWTLHLVGEKHDDIYSHQVDAVVNSESLKNQVFFYGSCLDIKYVLDQGTIAVLPSSSEGLPVSLLEYGLAGLPVVVTDVGECKNVVKNYGLVTSKENAVELANKIEIYINDEELRKLHAEQLKKHITENYSEKAYFSKLLKVYQTC